MATGLLILRIGLGLLLIGHGAQKLFGWFGGPGPAGTRAFLGSLGFRPVGAAAFLGGLAEAGGGLLLLLGFLTPLGTAAVVAIMVSALVAVHLSSGFWATNGGYEFVLLIAIVASALSFTGAGAYSIDNVLDLPLRGIGWGTAATGVGLLLAGLGLAARSKTPAENETVDLTDEREHAGSRS